MVSLLRILLQRRFRRGLEYTSSLNLINRVHSLRQLSFASRSRMPFARSSLALDLTVLLLLPLMLVLVNFNNNNSMDKR